MPNKDPLLQKVLIGFCKALGYCADLFGEAEKSPTRAISFLRELGWNIPWNANFQNSNLEFLSKLRQIRSSIESDNIDFLELINSLRYIFEARKVFGEGLDLGLANDFKDALKQELPYQMIDYAIIRYLEYEKPALHGVLVALGIIVVKYSELQNQIYVPCMKRTIRWSVIQKILSAPQRFLEYAYGWGLDTYNGFLLLDALEFLFHGIGLTTGRMQPDAELTDLRPITGEPLYVSLMNWPDELDVGLEFYRVENDLNSDKGLVLAPYIIGEAKEEIEVTDYLSLGIDSDIQMIHNLGIEAKSAGDIEVFGIGSPTPKNGKASITISVHPDGGIFMIGDPKGDQLSAESARIKLALVLKDGKSDLSTEVGLYGIHFIYGASDGDGFVSKILSGRKIDAQIDLIMGLQTGRGIYFQGSGKFDLNFPVHRNLGPLLIDSLRLSILPDEGEIPLALSATIGAKLGPINVLVKDLGILINFTCSKDGSYSSLEAIDIGFKPPDGVGLEIDAGMVKGGGGLIVENGNYSGWLELEINKKISVCAICIITTKPEFSFKILGFAEFPAIQVGFGFSISGVGLALAINCRMNEEKLRTAVFDGSLQSLLFPTNLIENAPQIIDDINNFFPEYDNTYIIGAMAKLGWGAGEPIITADVGIFLEFGSGLRIALAGIGCANLPNAQSPFLCLRFQVLGLIDFNNKTLSIDATINGSRLMEWALDGSMALRSSWGDKKRFALSIGGFYPGYKPPEGFPSLDRISLAIGTGNPKIQLLCYLAITENSVQIGAALIFYWHKKYDWPVDHIEVDGVVGFDALFQFNPFYFETKFYAAFSLKRNGDSFMSVDLRLMLSGPNNYHAVGKAKVEICGVGITVEFDKEFGSKRLETQQTLSPIEILKLELENEKNWFVRRLEDQDQVTILLDEEQALGVTERVEPLGTICFKQRAIPLQISIEKIGNAVPEGNERFFDIKSDADKKDEDLLEFFAPGDFEELSDEEKISAPAFEEMKCGIAITGGNEIECKFDSIQTRNVEYELKLPDTVSPSDGWRRFSPCFKTPALERMIQTTGRNLHTNKPSLLKEFDKADSFEVKEQKVTTIDDSFHASSTPTTYAQTRQEYKKNGRHNTISYIIDSARARNN